MKNKYHLHPFIIILFAFISMTTNCRNLPAIPPTQEAIPTETQPVPTETQPIAATHTNTNTAAFTQETSIMTTTVTEAPPQFTPTLYPTGTPYPIQTPQTAPEKVILMNPGIWSRDLSEYQRCDDLFEIKQGYKMPYFSYAAGNDVSKSQFLLINIRILNIANHTLPAIFHKQFKLIANLHGEQVEYVSYGPAGANASNHWETHFLSDASIPPGIELDTWIGFDVDYHATDWRLRFIPDAGSPYPCQFQLNLSEPEFPIQYLKTVESQGKP